MENADRGTGDDSGASQEVPQPEPPKQDKDNAIPSFQKLRVLPTECRWWCEGCIAPCSWAFCLLGLGLGLAMLWVLPLPYTVYPLSFPWFYSWGSIRTGTLSMEEIKGMGSAWGF